MMNMGTQQLTEIGALLMDIQHGKTSDMGETASYFTFLRTNIPGRVLSMEGH